MGTPLQKVWDAFLARITGDDWMYEEDIEIVEQDWRQFLSIAIYRLKFPRVDLTIDEAASSFIGELTNSEIQLLAVYMKHEWIKRCVADWENIKQLYVDRDFSQANHLDKLIKLEAATELECTKMYGIYDRARNGKPFDYSKLAGKQS